MANINIKISDEIHNYIRHARIDTKKTNDEIVETALKFYFESKAKEALKILNKLREENSETPIDVKTED